MSITETGGLEKKMAGGMMPIVFGSFFQLSPTEGRSLTGRRAGIDPSPTALTLTSAQIATPRIFWNTNSSVFAVSLPGGPEPPVASFPIRPLVLTRLKCLRRPATNANSRLPALYFIQISPRK